MLLCFIFSLKNNNEKFSNILEKVIAFQQGRC